jgi:hypothetical protein
MYSGEYDACDVTLSVYPHQASLMELSDLSQGCSNKSDTVMINKNATRLTTQGCNNTAISRLYRTCWNNLVTSLIISTRLLQIVNSLFQTC